MKTIPAVGMICVAALFFVAPNAHAIQVSYTLNEVGGSGLVKGSDPAELNNLENTELGTYQFTGSVTPERVGLIGVQTGFRAAVARFVPGFTPDGGGDLGGGDSLPDSELGGLGPGENISTQWSRVTVNTNATGLFSTKAEINGLSPTNNVGFVRFDWVITGVSSLFLDTGDGEFGTGVTVSDASSLATIVALTEPESFSDSSLHSPVRGVNGSTEDLNVVNLQAESFLVPYDFQQLAEGEIPTLDVAFEFSASTSLDITNDNDLGSFEALFDADFSNTATLASVTVLDSNELEIPDTSVVDAVTGSSLVASTVPEPSSLMLVALVGCAGSIRRRRRVTCGR